MLVTVALFLELLQGTKLSVACLSETNVRSFLSAYECKQSVKLLVFLLHVAVSSYLDFKMLSIQRHFNKNLFGSF